MSRVLVLSFDPVTEQMPGPAIRAWNLAAQLATEHDVTLASTAGADRTHPAMAVVSATGPDVDELVPAVDVVFAPSSVVRRHPIVVSSGLPLCIDMYDPTHLENLEAVGAAGDEAHVKEVAHQVSVLNDDLLHGDFFLCASQRQHDFWLGSLASLGRVNPSTYAADPMLRNLVAVVPFGIDREPPVPEPGALRQLFPRSARGSGADLGRRRVQLVRSSFSAVRDRRVTGSSADAWLVFLGMRHPNPEIPEMRVAAQLRGESERLGLTGTHVFFNPGWVSYDRRGAYLLDADVGVSTHLTHVETYFSFRTRVLDYLWAGLPTVLTGGDALSEDIAAAGVGAAVPDGDPAAIATAIEGVLAAPPDRSAVRAFGPRYSWERTAKPLLDYCHTPWKAADRELRDRLPSDARAEEQSRPARASRWTGRLSRH